MRANLRRLHSLDATMMRADRRRKLEAAVCLLLARGVLAMVPFRWLRRWLETPVRRHELAGRARGMARREVREAVDAASQRLPGTWVCFPRALAAQAMLRRRGVSTTLYYGAFSAGEGLTGHVWLTDGDHGIVGTRAAADCHVLAAYSPRRGEHRVRSFRAGAQ